MRKAQEEEVDSEAVKQKDRPTDRETNEQNEGREEWNESGSPQEQKPSICDESMNSIRVHVRTALVEPRSPKSVNY